MLRMDIRNLGLKNSCEHFIKHVKNQNKHYYYLRDNLCVLVNNFFYKKLKQEKVYRNSIIKKWKRIIPRKLINSPVSYEMMVYMNSIMESYDTDINLKCIANPINLKLNEIPLKGQIDLITKEDNYYNVYYFLYNSLHELDINFMNNVMPGILSLGFYSDFKKGNFNIIVHNISTNKKRVIKDAGEKSNVLIKKTLSLTSKIKDNCKGCTLRGKCKHEKYRS